MDKAYMVLVTANLLGGGTIADVDIFRADSGAEALNYARNIFIKEATGAVVYGDTIFFSEGVTAISSKVVGVLDLNHPENKPLLDAADVFENYLKAEDES